MNHTIFYFTGTGNSLWVARKLGEELEHLSPPCTVKIVPITKLQASTTGTVEQTISPNASTTVGLVFPVHAWGVPSIILKSLDFLRGAGYCYALAVNAGQVANTLVQLSREMDKKGMTLSAGFSIRMPSNYLPFGEAPKEETQQTCFREAEEKLKQVARVIMDQLTLPVEKGPLWQNFILSGLHSISAQHFPSMDKRFIVEDTCTSCGVCERICPVENIQLENGRPVWSHHCEQCYACIQWCPVEAIQYGKGTVGKKRYHHPEITLQDIERTRGTSVN